MAKNESVKAKSAENSSRSTSVKHGVNKIKTEKQTESVKGFKNKVLNLTKQIAKIDNLPKNVRESIPFRGITSEGIIETYKGTFTKSYHVEDVNFDIASDEEQIRIFKRFNELLNSFNENIRWQFTIFNHELDKKQTLESIRILPQKDGLNKYRQEMNHILLGYLKEGNNSIKQDKYLTVSVKDKSADHAIATLKRADQEIGKRLDRISKSNDEDRAGKLTTKALSTQERLNLLYDIYNQDYDYRMASGVFDVNEDFNLALVEKAGLSVKDIIGPVSMDFSDGKTFMLGDTYAHAMYLEKVPNRLSTSFLADLSSLQCNMLISTTSESISSEDSEKMVRSKLASIEARVTDITQRNNNQMLFNQTLPPEVENAQAAARDLLNDIQKRDQSLFLITFLVVVFARTREQLDANIQQVINVGKQYKVPIKSAKYQQEFAFNTALPLCRNDMFLERLYTTESASVFLPYKSQEVSDKNAICYGLNQTTSSMILYDRTTANNFNGLLFGAAGSGKSFKAKVEMINVLLNKPNAQIFVIDPQGEYYPLASALNGQLINLAPGSGVYINPLDLDIAIGDEDGSGDSSDPVTLKSDYVISVFEILIGENRSLDPTHISIIDKSVRKIYKPYIAYLEENGITCDPSKCPTLSDLYQELVMLSQESYEAKQLSEFLYSYAVGSFDTFAHRTNVKTNSRLVVYNTKKLGVGMKKLGLHVCTNDIWNRMIENSKKDIYTWLYIDEFHLLLDTEGTVRFLQRLWKMARKWLGVPTGIMQSCEDLTRTKETRDIVKNTSFVLMLRSEQMDRQDLQDLFNLSQAQVEYIEEAERGCGLFYNGKVIIPFREEFPKNTELYKILSTSHDVEGAKFV